MTYEISKSQYGELGLGGADSDAPGQGGSGPRPFGLVPSAADERVGGVPCRHRPQRPPIITDFHFLTRPNLAILG